MTNIPKPYRYGEDWLVFPDTTYTKLDILDCDDTTRGLCIEDMSINQCIDECKKFSKYCTFGYYVKTRGGKSLCAPLRTIEIYPDLNPVSIIANKDTYPEFVNAEVSTFMNAKVHPFPRNQSNTVFYRDIMNLYNVETNTSVDTNSDSLKHGSNILFTKGDSLNVTFFPKDRNTINIAPYVPIMYGDHVSINVANSALVMKKDETTEDIRWSHSLGILDDDFSFVIMPLSRGKIGEPVAYGDKIAILCSVDGYYLVVNPKIGNVLTAHSGDIDRILDVGSYYPTFMLESEMMAYYCDKKECKSVPVSKLTVDGVSGTYNGSLASRLKGCLGMCSYSPNGEFSLSSLQQRDGKSEKSNVVKIVLIIVVLMILMYLCRKLLIYHGGR